MTGLHDGPAGQDGPTEVPAEVDVTAPNVARIYDYFLGGKDNYLADRQAAEQILRLEPSAIVGVRQNRQFPGRVVLVYVQECGQDSPEDLPEAASDAWLCGVVRK